LIDLIAEDGAADVVSRIQHVLKFIQMIGVIDELVLIAIHSGFDLDGNRVAQIALRIDISFATITAVSNHDLTPLNLGEKRGRE
jgi:hypothetical protein